VTAASFLIRNGHTRAASTASFKGAQLRFETLPGKTARCAGARRNHATVPERPPVDGFGEWPVVVARISDQINRHSHLAERAVHFLGLAERVRGVRLPLQK
jgi:hypothetical protein